MDSQRYPRVAAYLSSLPAGLDSYPACHVLRDLHAHHHEDYPRIKDLPGVPAPLVEVLAGRVRGDWLPEVHGNALYLLIRDAFADSDAAFMDWNRRNVLRTFSGPLYRALMFVLSTSLVIMGATKRWAAFHRGTAMSVEPIRVEGQRKVCVATLTFPPLLFTDFMLRQHCSTFLAALEASRAVAARVEVAGRDEQHAIFHASWQA